MNYYSLFYLELTGVRGFFRYNEDHIESWG